MPTEKPSVKRLTMTVEEAGEAIGVSRGTAFALARQGRLGAVRVGQRRWVVPVKAIERLLNLSDSQGS